MSNSSSFQFSPDSEPTVDIRLKQVRQQCLTAFRQQFNRNPTRTEYRSQVAQCMLSTLNELEKAVLASRQYILTLWPAFIGFIVSLGPDPGYMVYDNFWWSLLFALTSSGLPGLSNDRPPHHLEVLSTQNGREKCKGYEFDENNPRILSRSVSRYDFTSRKGLVYMEWFAFIFSFLCYWTFCILFGWTLDLAVSFAFQADQWLGPGVWYYISASPAVAAACAELAMNRIELYEPVVSPTLPVAAIADHALAMADKVVENQSVSERSLQFERTTLKTTLHLWLRIVHLQWSRARYRILIKPRPENILEMMWSAIVILGRITVFAVGSVSMGNVLLMPIPQDLALFVLLLFVTAIPRCFWPYFWRSGSRGADLVVWVVPAGNSDKAGKVRWWYDGGFATMFLGSKHESDSKE